MAKEKKTKKEVKKEIKKEIRKPERKFHAWWIVGFIFPIIGIFLYIMWKNNRKEDAKSVGTGTLISVIAWMFVGMSFLVNTKGEPKVVQTVQAWHEDYENGETFVTVLAMSTCQHCQNLKPIIKASSSRYGYKLYFFEVDKLSEDDYNTLTTTIPLDTYEGYVPYVFSVVNKKLTNSTTGEMPDEDLTDFLKKGKIIEG